MPDVTSIHTDALSPFAHTSALLNITQHPRFADMRAQDLDDALDIALHEAETALITLTQQTHATWENVVIFLDTHTASLHYAWGIANHFSGVVDSQDWRDAIRKNLPRITEFWLKLSQNPALYAHYQTLSQASDLSTEQKKVVLDALLQFKLGGAELLPEQRPAFIEWQNTQAQLSKKISDNTLDATDALNYEASKAELDGVPDIISQNWWSEEKQCYNIKLHQPYYGPIMQYAHARDLRERLYKASVTRASNITQWNQGKLEWCNDQPIAQLREVRQKSAHLLGFANYAELSVATKMAENAQEVLDFIHNIIDKAKPCAQNDWQQLNKHAQHMGIDKMQWWDMAYVAENLRQKDFVYSEQEVREYFTLDKVLQGLFGICQTLFDINIQESTPPSTWHEDVRFFTIFAQGQATAYFYLDLFARERKHSGAWMNHALSYRVNGQDVQCPVAYLVCNFQKMINDNNAYAQNGQAHRRPSSQLTHYEVMTLFHEFGHGLHHMLTKVALPGASGIDGVEWDAVELPSQFMENFCWDFDTLQNMSAHAKTGQALPCALFEKMLAAKNYQNGLATLRQTMFALVDMHAHMDTHTDVLDLARNTQIQHHVTPVDPLNHWPYTFTHVFSGGYAAGYYSYHWAEVLSSDAFSAFEESAAQGAPLINHELGEKYQAEILARGGSRSALENFIAFRGRKPNSDAFLRHNGLV